MGKHASRHRCCLLRIKPGLSPSRPRPWFPGLRQALPSPARPYRFPSSSHRQASAKARLVPLFAYTKAHPVGPGARLHSCAQSDTPSLVGVCCAGDHCEDSPPPPIVRPCLMRAQSSAWLPISFAAVKLYRLSRFPNSLAPYLPRSSQQSRF